MHHIPSVIIVEYALYLCIAQIKKSKETIDTNIPMCSSISMIFSMLAGTISGDVTRFSTARTTPPGVWIPMAVDPNCKFNTK